MNWIIIIIFVVIVILLIKMRAFKHKFMMITLLILILFIYVTYSKVAAANSLKIKNPADIIKAGKIYFSWLGNAIGNIKLITSNTAKMDWAIKNKTLTEVENED